MKNFLRKEILVTQSFQRISPKIKIRRYEKPLHSPLSIKNNIRNDLRW